MGRDERRGQQMQEAGQGVSAIDVLQRMVDQLDRGEGYGNEIYFGNEIISVKKVRAGTIVEVGIGGDLIGGIASGRLVGGVFLWNRERFREVRAEIGRERAANNGGHGEDAGDGGDTRPGVAREDPEDPRTAPRRTDGTDGADSE